MLANSVRFENEEEWHPLFPVGAVQQIMDAFDKAMTQNQEEAREFIDFVRAAGGQFRYTDDFSDLRVVGTKLSRENKKELKRLKPMVLAVLKALEIKNSGNLAA